MYLTLNRLFGYLAKMSNWFGPKEETEVELLGDQGWRMRSGESARLPVTCSGFDSWTRRHMHVG